MRRNYQRELGLEEEQKKHFYGHNAHVSLNAESGMITNLVVTPRNAHNGHKLPELENRDRELGLAINGAHLPKSDLSKIIAFLACWL